MRKFLILGKNVTIKLYADEIRVMHNGDFRLYKGGKFFASFSLAYSWVELNESTEIETIHE